MLVSLIPLKSAFESSLLLLLTDSNGVIKVISSTGRTIAVDYLWNTYPGTLQVVCQLGIDQFIFATRGTAISTCTRDKLVLRDIAKNKSESQAIGVQTTSIFGTKGVVVQKTYQADPKTSNWHQTLVIDDFNVGRHWIVVEPMELSNLPMFYIPGSAVDQLLYFFTLPCTDIFLNTVAVVQLYKDATENLKYQIIECQPDKIFGWPSSKVVKSLDSGRKCKDQSFFVKDGKIYFLDVNRPYEIEGMWRLHLDEQSGTCRWEKLLFKSAIHLMLNCSFKFVINDEGEVMMVQESGRATTTGKMQTKDRERVDVFMCARLKVASLKHLAAKVVIDAIPNFVQLDEQEQRQLGLPSGCVPSCPWISNFSPLLIIED